MSVFTATQPMSSAPTEPWHCHTAIFITRWLDDETAVVACEGEIDAVNAASLGDYVGRVVMPGNRLVLDLSAVNFFGTEGFAVLNTISARCAEAGVRWVTVPSPAVARVLRICDADGVLVAATTMDAGLAALQRDPRPVLHLISR